MNDETTASTPAAEEGLLGVIFSTEKVSDGVHRTCGHWYIGEPYYESHLEAAEALMAYINQRYGTDLCFQNASTHEGELWGFLYWEICK